MVGRRILVATARALGGGQQAEILARALRDGGDEVIFTGPDQSVHQIGLTAIAEDAVEIRLPGADAKTRSAVVAFLAERDADEIDVAVDERL